MVETLGITLFSSSYYCSFHTPKLIACEGLFLLLERGILNSQLFAKLPTTLVILAHAIINKLVVVTVLFPLFG